MTKYKLVYEHKRFGKTYVSEGKCDTKDGALVQLGKVIEGHRNAIKRGTATVVIKDNIVIISGREIRGGCCLEDFYEEYTIVKIMASKEPICSVDINPGIIEHRIKGD